MKAFQAYSKHGKILAVTPRLAALAFFKHFPKARKCNIIEGEKDGVFFTVRYGRASAGEWPQSFKDVTKKTIDTLPDSRPDVE